MTLLERWRWVCVAALSLIALALRTVRQFDSVFQGSFVNFQETDAWYHVRAVDNLVRHFPWRMETDPYLHGAPVSEIPTGPFYDWLLAGIAWMAGFGHPPEQLVHSIAAWYPAVLGAFVVPVVYLLGERVSGVRTGLLAAAVVATLPGHFLIVSSLGFTDHHVMESLLSALYMLTLLRAIDRPQSNTRAALAGFVLAAYLLTFVGGAFFIAIVVAWAAFDRMRAMWPREEAAFQGRPLYVSLLWAATLVAPYYSQLWMPFSIAALVGGAVGVLFLERWGVYCRAKPHSRLLFFAGLAGAVAIATASATRFAPGALAQLGSVAKRLFPAYFGTTGAVGELQALVMTQGAFSLVPAWRQFAGAYILSIVALVLLGELGFRRPARGATLLLVWGSSTFLLAMGQVRMTYYFAVAAALLSGYLMDWILRRDTRALAQWVVLGTVAVAVVGPNLLAAMDAGRRQFGVSADWLQALNWLRTSTPEPFGDSEYYYARYRRDTPEQSAAYRIMAWWDYGYWLQAVARRVPVANPTQANAALAARFFLSQTEEEALRILAQTQSQFVVADAALPMRKDREGTTRGFFPSFFVWDKTKNIDDYFLVTVETAGGGEMRQRLLYRPAYFRSITFRLFAYGGAAEGAGNASVAYFDKQTAGLPTLKHLRRFSSEEAAMAAERECRSGECALVSDNPLTSCVRLEALRHFRPAFSSGSVVLQAETEKRSAVQVYEVLP